MGPMSPAQRSSLRGFTLVEVMIVVVIVGVLSALAVYGVKRYVDASKSSEAIHMIGSIKAAEEAYREETYAYLDVAGAGKDLSTDDILYPRVPGKLKSDWTNNTHACYPRWVSLGVQSSGPVYFGYAVKAGKAGDSISSVSAPRTKTAYSFGPYATAPGPWYVVQAMGDVNGDTNRSVFLASNWTTDIYVENDGN